MSLADCSKCLRKHIHPVGTRCEYVKAAILGIHVPASSSSNQSGVSAAHTYALGVTAPSVTTTDALHTSSPMATTTSTYTGLHSIPAYGLPYWCPLMGLGHPAAAVNVPLSQNPVTPVTYVSTNNYSPFHAVPTVTQPLTFRIDPAAGITPYPMGLPPAPPPGFTVPPVDPHQRRKSAVHSASPLSIRALSQVH